MGAGHMGGEVLSCPKVVATRIPPDTKAQTILSIQCFLTFTFSIVSARESGLKPSSDILLLSWGWASSGSSRQVFSHNSAGTPPFPIAVFRIRASDTPGHFARFRHEGTPTTQGKNAVIQNKVVPL